MTGWGLLSGATLRGSHWILTLYEKDVFLDAQNAILGAGGFNVLVLKECSGYEGIGLVLSFLALYCVFMRRRLRFPHAFVLFPIGLATVWLMNCVRIAALVSIGRHLSPTIALDGFHSQAGWIGFLIVTIGVMVVSQKPSFFRRPRNSQTTRRLVDEPQVAFLAPFAVLMATSVIASLFAPHDQWLYVLKVVSVAAILGYFWRSYDSIWAPVSPISIVIGVVAGVVWAATDPSAGDLSALTAWLDSQPPWLRLLWLSLRSAGLVLCVPMAEELAFRGYLQRVLISRNFSRVSPEQFSWLSFVMTSALFGLLHERWLAGALAGALYSCLTYRTNRLPDAIAAHVTTNAVILIWAIAGGQLSLL